MTATTFNPNAAKMQSAASQQPDVKAAEAYATALRENQEQVAATRNLKTEKYKKYKNALQSCNFLFKDGTQAKFVNGVYLTNNPLRIHELDTEVANGHPHIYIDANDVEVSEEDMNPETALRNKYFAEFKAAQEAEANRDMGTSEQGKLKAANTKDMAANISNGAAALGGVPVSVLAALNNQSSSIPTAG